MEKVNNNYIKSLLERRKNGIHSGIPSFCTANKIAIEAILEETKNNDEYDPALPTDLL